jgi:hypothetical protein
MQARSKQTSESILAENDLPEETGKLENQKDRNK